MTAPVKSAGAKDIMVYFFFSLKLYNHSDHTEAYGKPPMDRLSSINAAIFHTRKKVVLQYLLHLNASIDKN